MKHLNYRKKYYQTTYPLFQNFVFTDQVCSVVAIIVHNLKITFEIEWKITLDDLKKKTNLPHNTQISVF